MSIRTRSLLSNSFTSLLASGMLIFSTVLIPAILVRSISRNDYDLFSLVLAALPPLSIIPQSLRSSAASQLALAFSSADERTAIHSYLVFSTRVALALAAMSIAGVEIYLLSIEPSHRSSAALLRFGLYCMVGHVLGLMAVGVFTGPASAHRDFLPDNLAKLWPGLFHLTGIAAVWVATPAQPLFWIFAVHLFSSWSAALLLSLWQMKSFRLGQGSGETRDRRTECAYWAGLRGSAWWNLTAYFATTAAVLVVAITHPASIVPFSVATSVLGIMAAALIAVASPISGHAASLLRQPTGEERRFFLTVNTLFQLYVLASMILLWLLPQQLLALWLEPRLAGEVRHFILWLLPAYAMRLLSMAFTVFVMSAGRQSSLWLSPAVEAGIAVSGCLILSQAIGMIGVPIALTISAAVRLILTVTHDEALNLSALRLRRGDILLSGLRLVKAW